MNEASTSLQETLRMVHQRLEKICIEEDELDEIETNIAAGLKTLPYYLPDILIAEMEAIEDLIMTENFYKPDFNDRTSYDLTTVYKKYFCSTIGENCQSTPEFLTKASVYGNEKTIEHANQYYQDKILKLLHLILVVKNHADQKE
jgi:uncharacterized Fe-S cluster-containing MiaB family protein